MDQFLLELLLLFLVLRLLRLLLGLSWFGLLSWGDWNVIEFELIACRVGVMKVLDLAIVELLLVITLGVSVLATLLVLLLFHQRVVSVAFS